MFDWFVTVAVAAAATAVTAIAISLLTEIRAQKLWFTYCS